MKTIKFNFHIQKRAPLVTNTNGLSAAYTRHLGKINSKVMWEKRTNNSIGRTKLTVFAAKIHK